MTATRYTTLGSVRQGCRHAHATLDAAERCLARDRRACARARGYSDRAVFAYVGRARRREMACRPLRSITIDCPRCGDEVVAVPVPCRLSVAGGGLTATGQDVVLMRLDLACED